MTTLDAVKQVLTQFPKDRANANAGKNAALQYLIGQVMRVTKGKADPVLARQLLIHHL
jgi:aspartyl-tRNA(Asn)/glutamyl-tRNA(Gln) amidotransferase subunit B